MSSIVGLNLVWVKKVRVANLLFAIAVAVVMAFLPFVPAGSCRLSCGDDIRVDSVKQHGKSQQILSADFLRKKNAKKEK